MLEVHDDLLDAAKVLQALLLQDQHSLRTQGLCVAQQPASVLTCPLLCQMPKQLGGQRCPAGVCFKLHVNVLCHQGSVQHYFRWGGAYCLRAYHRWSLPQGRTAG